MAEIPCPRFELRKITDSEWLILDHRYATNDPRQMVARLYKLDALEVEATWLRDLPLASYYMSPPDALEELRRFYLPDRAKPPVPIPHLPPLASSA